MSGAQALGFIGLGNIGGGVSANLVEDGHQVSVFDIDDGRLKVLADAGATPAGSVAEVAAASEITFLSLPTPAAMEAVAWEWLEAARGTGKLLVDLTTNAPATVRTVGARLEQRPEPDLVEAPLTGGAIGAQNRSLVFIVGGEADQVARVTPLLDSLGHWATVHLDRWGPATWASSSTR